MLEIKITDKKLENIMNTLEMIYYEDESIDVKIVINAFIKMAKEKE